MNGKQVLFYGVLQMIYEAFLSDTTILGLGTLWNFYYLLKYFPVSWPDSGTRNKFLLIIFIYKNQIKRGKYGITYFKEIFYYGMTKFMNTNFVVFVQYQYTRTILRNKISMKYHTVHWLD